VVNRLTGGRHVDTSALAAHTREALALAVNGGGAPAVSIRAPALPDEWAAAMAGVSARGGAA